MESLSIQDALRRCRRLTHSTASEVYRTRITPRDASVHNACTCCPLHTLPISGPKDWKQVRVAPLVSSTTGSVGAATSKQIANALSLPSHRAPSSHHLLLATRRRPTASGMLRRFGPAHIPGLNGWLPPRPLLTSAEHAVPKLSALSRRFLKQALRGGRQEQGRHGRVSLVDLRCR